MCLVGDRQQHAERVDAAAIHSDRVQQKLNKPRGRSSCTLQAAPKEFAAPGPESVEHSDKLEQLVIRALLLHRKMIRGSRRWRPVMSSCSTPPRAWIRLPHWHYRAEASGEGSTVCAGIDRAPSQPRHHRLTAGTAERTHRRGR
jgi:hypothetical protein